MEFLPRLKEKFGRFDMKSQPRIFTLEEANALLPRLERMLSELMEKKEACERLHDYYFMDELLTQAESEGLPDCSGARLDQEAQSLDRSAEEFRGEVDKIRELGCIVRSIERGSIEFQSKRDGEPIYLCWRLGETAVRYFRFPGEDENERRRLPE